MGTDYDDQGHASEPCTEEGDEGETKKRQPASVTRYNAFVVDFGKSCGERGVAELRSYESNSENSLVVIQ